MNASMSGLKADADRDKGGCVIKERPSRLTGPIQFVLKLLELWNLPRRCAFKLLGLGNQDESRAESLLSGEEPLQDENIRNRIAHLVWIRATLHSLFQDFETENDWLREAHMLLDNRSPLSLLLEGSDAGLLAVRDYVDSVASQ